MRQYSLSLSGPDGSGCTAVPGPILERVELLFSEICKSIVKAELRIQGDVHHSLTDGLSIGGGSPLEEDAREYLWATLDYLGGASRGTWLDDTFPDILGRCRIAEATLAISDSLEGHALSYGPEDSVRSFTGVDRIWVMGMTKSGIRAYNGAAMGAIVKDPSRKGHWALTNGDRVVPVSFNSSVSSYDREEFSKAGPVIVTGTMMLDDEGNIAEIRSIDTCYTFPAVRFTRIIVPEGNLALEGEIVGTPGYYFRNGTWYLKCDDLGIESSSDSWDGCVMGFHRMFADLRESYAEGRGEPNARLESMVRGLCPF